MACVSVRYVNRFRFWLGGRAKFKQSSCHYIIKLFNLCEWRVYQLGTSIVSDFGWEGAAKFKQSFPKTMPPPQAAQQRRQMRRGGRG